MSLRSPLPSVFHRFDRVCHRLCQRPFDRVTSPIRSAFFDPPIPLGAIEALAAASVAASATVAWKGRARTPACGTQRHNRQSAAGWRCIIRRRWPIITGYVWAYGSKVGSTALKQAFDCAQNQKLMLVASPVCTFGEGFLRALSHELQHSWKQRRPRPRARDVCRQMPYGSAIGIQKKTPQGKKPRARHRSTSHPNFAAVSEKIAGHLSANLVDHC